MADLSPLSGEERKSDFRAVRSVDDPERTGYGSISRSVGSGSAPAAVSIAWT
jgi:hypothetical protein